MQTTPKASSALLGMVHITYTHAIIFLYEMCIAWKNIRIKIIYYRVAYLEYIFNEHETFLKKKLRREVKWRSGIFKDCQKQQGQNK